ncbi:hypothetical protein [Chryseobacterium oncorhynchi]|uniref:Uncharacterized protein n=1 Tax=Chryseobacterium oncorhynchi TaxID=741074 RepID=A0A316X5G4_9FLAO|nr:hypothetical protein [Chryseobacterium oncorhynchi]PWN68066.1 hypothetical protein C1638_005575 [Chryseobacterium oncorhynchi]
MVKNIIILVCSAIFFHSCAQSRKLENGRKVLTRKFKNIEHFDKSIFKDIDVDYFYKKVDFYMADKNFNKVRDIGNDINRKIQFYENGRVRFISVEMNEPDPEKTGMRGVIYFKKNLLKIDTQFASQGGHISKGTYSVKVEGDKLYLLDDNLLIPQSEYICFIYQKSEKIPENWKQYKADW